MNIISSTQKKKPNETTVSIFNTKIKLITREIQDYQIIDGLFSTPVANEQKLRSIYTKAKNTINENRKLKDNNSAKEIIADKMKRVDYNNKEDKAIGYMNSSMNNITAKTTVKYKRKLNSDSHKNIFYNKANHYKTKSLSPIKNSPNRPGSKNSKANNHVRIQDSSNKQKNINNNFLLKRKKYAETIKKTLNKASTSNTELNSLEESMIMNVSVKRKTSCRSMSQNSLKKRIRSLSKERARKKHFHYDSLDLNETNKKLEQIALDFHNDITNITPIKSTPKKIDEYRSLKRIVVLKSINI